MSGDPVEAPATRNRLEASGGTRRRELLLGGSVAVGLVASGCSASAPILPPKGMALSKTPLIGKFVWRDLLTDNPAAARPFYAGLFGWEFEERTAMGRPYTLVRSGGQYIGGIARAERREVQQPNSQWLSYLSVPDVDRAAERTRAAGGSVVLAPFDLQKVGRAAVVIDPQGAPLGLLRATFGDPADTPEPGLNGFLWTEELVRDPQAAAQFYVELVGYEVLVHDDGDKPFRVLKLGGRERAGIMRMPFGGMQPLWLVSVRVADPAASAQRAHQLGGRVLVTPRMDVRKGSVALVADPGGAVLALQRWPS